MKVAPSPVDKTEKYGVTVVADNADEKTLEREIFIPKLKTSNIKLLLDRNSLVNGNTLYLKFKIINEGNEIIDLSKLCTRYYYIDESTNISKQINCDWAQFDNPYGTLKSNITMKSVQNIKPLRKDANAYVEFGFNSSTKQLAPGQEATISARVNNSSWANMIVTNDYSYIGNNKAVQNGYVLWEYMPVYDISDTKNPIFGIEPPIGDNLESNLLVEFKPQQVSGSNCMNLNIKVKNTGVGPISLRDININYYYTNDNEYKQISNINWAGGRIANSWTSITSSTQVSIDELDKVRNDADTCVKISFNDSRVLEYEDYVEVKVQVYNQNWRMGKYDLTNDHSYKDYSINPTDNEWAIGNNIVIMDRNKSLQWGNEPKIIDMTLQMNAKGILWNRMMNLDFRLVNSGDAPINLRDIELKYFYTNDNNAEFSEKILSKTAKINTGNYITDKMEVSIVSISPQNQNELADTYLIITFPQAQGVLEPGENMNIKATIMNNNLFTGYILQNDFSFLPFVNTYDTTQAMNINNVKMMSTDDTSEPIYETNNNTLIIVRLRNQSVVQKGNDPSNITIISRLDKDYLMDAYNKYKRLQDTVNNKYKLSFAGYEFLYDYEIDERKLVNVANQYTPGSNSKVIIITYSIKGIKSQDIGDEGLTIGIGTYIEYGNSRNEFIKNLAERGITPNNSKYIKLYDDILQLYDNYYTNKKIDNKYAANLVVDFDMAVELSNQELIKHEQKINDYANNIGDIRYDKTITKILEFTYYQYDSLVTWRYNRGSLNEWLGLLVERENKKVTDWIDAIYKNAPKEEYRQGVINRWLDQMEMYLYIDEGGVMPYRRDH